MRITTLLSSLLVTGLLIAMPAKAANYNIDIPGQHAFITFKASHLGYSFIVGGFNKFEGKFNHDASNPGASKVSVTIDAASIDTNHAERDKHLRSEDFLDVSKHPTIYYPSRSPTHARCSATIPPQFHHHNKYGNNYCLLAVGSLFLRGRPTSPCCMASLRSAAS